MQFWNFLPGHRDRSSTLHELTLCLSNRYENQGVVNDLEEVVTLGPAELELCPRGHPDHAASLHNLARDPRKRFTEKAAIRDLEESIELLRPALELRPPGHVDRFSTLHELNLLSVCQLDTTSWGQSTTWKKLSCMNVQR